VLLVIFGAGASYDSVAHFTPSANSIEPDVEQHRPPLANQLFDGRRTFVESMQRFPDFKPLATQLRFGGPVERQLAEFEEQAKTFPERYSQLAAIRYYLHDILWRCQKSWFTFHHGNTNYLSFIDAVERWRHEVNRDVCFVTFNYDTMIEQAMEERFGWTFTDFAAYTSRPRYRLIKLHGSIDWGLEIDSGPTDPKAVIKSAGRGLSVTQFFRKVVRPGIVFHDGTVGYPAIAVPVEKKSEFSCPPEHLQALADVIPNVTKIITIGWRATEQHFLKMLHMRLTGLPEDVNLMVVSGSQKGAEETADNLAIPYTQRKRQLRGGGFTNLVKNIDQLDNFLR
jgi:hypothetical protein